MRPGATCAREVGPVSRSALAAGAAVATAVLLIAAGPVRAQVSDVPAAGLTAGSEQEGHPSVQALAVTRGNVLYVGGAFGGLAARTGHFVRLDASGARDTTWPEVDGSVDAVAPDGAGGWFIGGRFTHVGGQSRARLAHLGADGQLDPAWRPAVTLRARGPKLSGVLGLGVSGLCVVGDTVYVGGGFTSVNGQPREHLAAVNARTGELLAWDPRPNSDVYTLTAASGTVYVGGHFTRIGGTSRRRLAAFDTTSGALTAWNPGVAGRVRLATDPVVTALAIDRGRLYVGGRFYEIAGQDRAGLAAFDIASGALTTWKPRGHEVFALAVSGETVYAGGMALQCDEDGCFGEGFAAFDARTGRTLPWPAGLDDAGSSLVHALAVAGDRVYLGGDFTSLARQPSENLGALSAMTGTPIKWNPGLNGRVTSLMTAGDGVLVGGDFSGLDSAPRNSLAAVALGTGALLPFDAHAADLIYGVSAVVARGDAVFVAGDFESIGGRPRRPLAKLDADTGRAQRLEAAMSWSDSVRALAVDGRRLYVGGHFGRISGRRRLNLAALNPDTGRATSWRMDANRSVSALVIHGQTLYVTGAFTRLGGHRRRHIAAIDLSTGRLTPWNPDADGPVHALAFARGHVYLGGDFRHVRGRSRTNLAAVSASNAKLQTWHPRANAPVYALAVLAGTVYAGGEFSSIAGASRAHIAALDAASGTPTAWNPGANDTVTELLATPGGLIAGGAFGTLGQTSQTGFGVFPTAAQALPASRKPLPTVMATTLRRPSLLLSDQR
jgi:trimeric autotransporter adhesin